MGKQVIKFALYFIKVCFCPAIFLFFHGYLLAADLDARVVISNAYIIDGKGGTPINNGVIIIKGEKIVEIGAAEEIIIPKEATVFDAKGKTIMPGLADMHVHFMGGWDGNKTELLGFQRYLNAYLYAGVTTILDTGNIEPYILQLKQEVNSGRLLGPDIHCVGPLIDGPDAQWPSFSVAISSNSQLPALVRNLKNKGVDLLKAYKGLSVQNIKRLVHEANKQSLAVIIDQGALNGSFELAQLGITAFAHISSVNDMLDETITLMKSKHISSMTTLTVLENYSHRRLNDVTFIEKPLIKDTTQPEFLEELRAHAKRKLSDNDKRKIANYSQQLARAQRNLKKMYDAGLLLIAGTDAPYPGVFQGEGIHRELELIVESGLTPLQAITLATKNAAQLLNKQHEWGTLSKGLIANMLIIVGRPDLDISHTRNIEQVMLKGKFLDRDKLKIDPNKDKGFKAAQKVETD